MSLGRFLSPAIVAGLSWTISGCSADSRQASTLALGGYRSIEVRAVQVAAPVPYDPERLSEELKGYLESHIQNNLQWKPGAKPVAALTVVITDYREPSRQVRLMVGMPKTMKYRLIAQDAESGQSLGSSEHTSRFGAATAGLLTQGLDGMATNRKFEDNVLFNASWFEEVWPQQVVKILSRARSQEPSIASQPSP